MWAAFKVEEEEGSQNRFRHNPPVTSVLLSRVARGYTCQGTMIVPIHRIVTVLSGFPIYCPRRLKTGIFIQDARNFTRQDHSPINDTQTTRAIIHVTIRPPAVTPSKKSLGLSYQAITYHLSFRTHRLLKFLFCPSCSQWSCSYRSLPVLKRLSRLLASKDPPSYLVSSVRIHT